MEKQIEQNKKRDIFYDPDLEEVKKENDEKDKDSYKPQKDIMDEIVGNSILR